MQGALKYSQIGKNETASSALSKIKADTLSCNPEYNKKSKTITGSVAFFNHQKLSPIIDIFFSTVVS